MLTGRSITETVWQEDAEMMNQEVVSIKMKQRIREEVEAHFERIQSSSS
jgi:hypothetical protein